MTATETCLTTYEWLNLVFWHAAIRKFIPVWMDETKVVYATRSNGNYEIALVNPDGTGHQQITSNTTDDVNPVWSPNGQKIAFQSYRDGQAEIYVMNADGSGVTRLTNDPEYDGMPTWSPDGQKIAFTSRRTGSYRIYTMNANGSNLVQRSTKPYSQSPAWSPDGSLIAFSADGNNDGWLETWATVAASTSESQWSTRVVRSITSCVVGRRMANR